MHRKSRFTLVMIALLLVVGMLGIQPAKPVQAAAPDLFFSEYIEGSSNNKAVEIFNGTGSTVTLSNYQILVFSDGSGTGTIINLSGTLQNNDVYVVANTGSNDNILALADQTSGSLSHNGDDAIALRNTLARRYADVIGQVGFDPGTSWGTDPVTTLDHTLVRKCAITSGDLGALDIFNPAIEWESYAVDTISDLGSHTTCWEVESLSPIINEFSASTTGTDVEFIEFFGSPNTDYSAYTLLGVEGDAESFRGNVDNLIPLGTTDANGFFLVNLAANTFENGSLSLLLVKDNTAIINMDIDTNDDGVIDDSYWSEITDSVAINDGVAGALTYATPVLGVAYDGLPFAPGGASRIPDGTDTDTTADWVRNDFDLAGIPGYPGEIAPGEAYNTPGASNRVFAETAPSVLSTNPANGANHPNNENITITFSEPVTVTDTWFSIVCTSSTHNAVVTDNDPIFTLNPVTDFVVGDSCTVTITAANVVDDDDDDGEFNTLLSDYTFTFTAITPPINCGDEYTPIYEIQGTGETSPLTGNILSTEGVVVGDYQTNAYVSGTKNGFYIQAVEGDGIPATSDGIFVYSYMKDVAVGDHVRVTGTVAEYIPTGYEQSLTQLTSVSQILTCDTEINITPTVLTLPVEDALEFESHEGMLVTIPNELILSEYFNFSRYGEIKATNNRFMQFTAVYEPDVDGYSNWVNTYFLNSITLDDGRTGQNPDPAYHPNGEEFTLDNLFRGGDTISNITGVFDHSFDLYRIQPRLGLGYFGATYTPVNTRTDHPEITEGDLKIASFNVLNYFVTLTSQGSICGPAGNQSCRGADSTQEFERQKAKIVAAMDIIDADIFGLMEIENDSPVSGNDAVADLVAGLNTIKGEVVYDYIVTGAIGTDVIKQAILFKPESVTPVGTYKILNSSVDSDFIDTANRPVIAQVFKDNLSGETFLVAVNHLKSKGSSCGVSDPDLDDGQGNCNQTRLSAAKALVDWLANPIYFPDVEKALIIGDLNSYDKEDPIVAIKLGADNTSGTDDDYLDMIFEKRGDYAYGYVYDGQMGYLDHALANQAMAESIVDVNFWHINADEPRLIDYDMNFKEPAQDALYAPDAYRSSDHDPVIITLERFFAIVALGQAVTAVEDTPIDITLVATDPENDELTYIIVDPPGNGTVDLTGSKATYSPDLNFSGEDSFTFKATDGSLISDVATVTITVTPTSDAPIGVGDAYTVLEDGQKSVSADFGVLANDVEPDGDTLFAVLVGDQNTAHGYISLAQDGSFMYTPDPDFNGEDSFTYKAFDGTYYSEEATVTITVTPAGDAPVLGLIEGATIPELVEFSFTAAATDIDLPDDLLTFSLVGAPAGAAIDAVTGVFTWTPGEEQGPGVHTFIVKVCDNTAPTPLCDEQEVTLTVTEVNTAPIALEDAYTMDEDTVLTVLAPGILANDTDADGDTITVDSYTKAPQFGTLILNADGSFTYTPGDNFHGTDSFVYKVIDGKPFSSDEATVTITVNPVNDAPVAVADDYTTNEDEVLTIDALTGVLANDTDIDHDELTAILVDDLSHGILALAADGSFVYTPAENSLESDSFTYKVSDGSDESDPVTVTITVTPVNDYVEANDDEYETMTGVTLEVAAPGVLENDVLLDPNEDISLAVIDQPSGGTITLKDDGSFTYVPNAGFFGVDTFEYQLTSTLPSKLLGESSDTAVVTITVKARQIFLPLILR